MILAGIALPLCYQRFWDYSLKNAIDESAPSRSKLAASIRELEQDFSRASVTISNTFSAPHTDRFLLVACWTAIPVYG